MTKRQNFSKPQRDSAFEQNAEWLRSHRVDGIDIPAHWETLRKAGKIYYCENCLFCHTDQKYFNVDHLVPDVMFKRWDKHPDARLAANMMVLCTSTARGEYGCNLSKGRNLTVPRQRGLAHTRCDIDMNRYPVHDRPFDWC